MDETVLQSNLRRLRKYNGYTQSQLGEFLGVTRQAYAHYELGDRIPNYVALTKIAEFYSISIDELLAPEGEYEKVKRDEKRSPYRFLPEKERRLIEMMDELPKAEQEDLMLYLKRKIERNKEREKKKREKEGKPSQFKG